MKEEQINTLKEEFEEFKRRHNEQLGAFIAVYKKVACEAHNLQE